MIAPILEKRPALGYIIASGTGAGSWLAIFDEAKAVVGLVAAVVSLLVGIYTLRIQIRTWKRGQK